MVLTLLPTPPPSHLSSRGNLWLPSPPPTHILSRPVPSHRSSGALTPPAQTPPPPALTSPKSLHPCPFPSPPPPPLSSLDATVALSLSLPSSPLSLPPVPRPLSTTPPPSPPPSPSLSPAPHSPFFVCLESFGDAGRCVRSEALRRSISEGGVGEGGRASYEEEMCRPPFASLPPSSGVCAHTPSLCALLSPSSLTLSSPPPLFLLSLTHSLLRSCALWVLFLQRRGREGRMGGGGRRQGCWRHGGERHRWGRQAEKGSSRFPFFVCRLRPSHTLSSPRRPTGSAPPVTLSRVKMLPMFRLSHKDSEAEGRTPSEEKEHSPVSSLTHARRCDFGTHFWDEGSLGICGLGRRGGCGCVWEEG